MSVERNDGTVKQASSVTYNTNAGAAQRNDGKDGLVGWRVHFQSRIQRLRGLHHLDEMSRRHRTEYHIDRRRIGRSVRAVGTYTEGDFKAELDAKYAGRMAPQSMDPFKLRVVHDEFLSSFSMESTQTVSTPMTVALTTTIKDKCKSRNRWKQPERTFCQWQHRLHQRITT